MDVGPLNFEAAGREMHELAAYLFPICRSMTGLGVRETLRQLQARVPLEIRELPSGTKVFDWEVPPEWSIRDAYIRDERDERVVDFRKSNLHVVSGSMPVNGVMRWSQLKGHLHTLPEQPELVPYRTCFHREDWGFCLSHALFERLAARGDVEYEVCIDSSSFEGSLTYGEFYLPGASDEEVLLSTHVCHPSLANDNLSGITVACQVARWLGMAPRRYSYRVLFLPATIGAIAWLCLNESRTARIKHGLVLALLGDPGHLTYRKSRRGAAEIDRAAVHVLNHSGTDFDVRPFEPFGYDQRQFCSPGFDLPMGCLMRSVNGEFPEYHTSADNLDFIRAEYLADSLAKCIAILSTLEGNQTYINQNPKCEPQLGKHGLYRGFGCGADQARLQQAVLWVLNLSDGSRSLLEIAKQAKSPFSEIRSAADALAACGLLKVAESGLERSPPAPASQHRQIQPPPNSASQQTQLPKGS